ncbi:hypothetical protein LEP1GSC062_2387 [Leptospira alexanderi serovar Manhao 3 str. L 60]|uniref:Uncharacterized protein n=1 Tax=Leptospira alexanderi serovar Manhao 3 str. L 60 TaxID=1049759 RepID=V6I3G9_9LEPT|nr:hypothetical protein LEP1GSC062_2387 [Leptospira alexanderi serovar Manhao 3 str. L 60]
MVVYELSNGLYCWNTLVEVSYISETSGQIFNIFGLKTQYHSY